MRKRQKTLAAIMATSVWRWAGILLSVVIAAVRPDLPLVPVVLLALYFVCSTFLLTIFHPKVAPELLAALDIGVLSLTVVTSGGDSSPVYILYVTTMLDVGSHTMTGRAAGLAVAAALMYTLAAWAASVTQAEAFDLTRAVTRSFLFVAAALTSSSLSQTAQLAHARAMEADSLNRMMRLAVAAGSDVPVVLRIVAQQVCLVLQADFAVTYLYSGSQDLPDLANYGWQATNLDVLQRAAAHDRLCQQVVTTGQVCTESDSDLIEQSGLAAVVGNINTVVCAPLMLEHEILGCLWLARRSAVAFNATEKSLLALMGQQAALAVRNARLHALESRALAELQLAEQAKTEFLATVSHELRTPLTALKASAGLLLDSGAHGLSPAQVRLIGSIARNTDRLTNMVTDLLDMARLQSGRLPLACALTDLRPVVLAAVASVRPLLEQKAQTIALQVDDNVPLIVADRRRVEQILTNLLSNAYHYTPHGGHVAVTVRSVPEAVEVAVTDNGPGVPLAERDLIFQRFYRGAAARHGDASGAGLGLAVAKSLVELHEGRIGYRDAAGGGSAFVFTLPLRGPKESDQ